METSNAYDDSIDTAVAVTAKLARELPLYFGESLEIQATEQTAFYQRQCI
jgi:hypothetical protein